MEYFRIVTGQITFFIVYALIGVYMIKRRIIDREGLNVLSRVITGITLPLLVFTNALTGTDREGFFSALPVLGLTAVMYLCLFLLSTAEAALLKLPDRHRDLFRAGGMFGNNSFMGIPIIAALFPSGGVLYIALVTILDQVVFWTLGLSFSTPPEVRKTFRTGEKLRRMLNPAMIGIIAAVIMILTETSLPEPLLTAFTKTGQISTPLALIYIGGVFCTIDFGECFRRREFYSHLVLKMCVFPILFFLAMSRLAGVQRDIAVTMAVVSGLPTMTALTMLAQSQGSDHTYTAGMVFFTTVLSIVTIPAVCLALGAL